MAQPDTVDRILDAAEHLFAERGFAETSLRTITGRAGVNLAAVNYHFGSKKALIQAVFERFLTPFCASLDQALDRRQRDTGKDALSLDDLLALVATVAVELHMRDPARGVTFMRLIGLAYNESQGHLRGYVVSRYGAHFDRLQRLLLRAVPGVPPAEMYWRVHFALGSAVFTLSGLAPMLALYQSGFGRQPAFPDVVMRLVPFIAYGIRQGAPR